MYYLSVGAMFKNERHIIVEWIKHYLHHGVEHFYLINDASTDDTVAQIQEYIDKGLITLFNVEEPYYLGRQRNLYNRHILPCIKQTKWLMMVDLDEYVWSRQSISLLYVLKSAEHLAQIQIRELLFGSNGHEQQPTGLVKSFTKRRAYRMVENPKLKYIVNSDYEFGSLNILHANFMDPTFIHKTDKFIIVDPDFLCYNHYNCQSREHWNTIKCTRGDADNYLVRTEEDFKVYDINEMEDLELVQQNASIV